jgi:hypothetical protein
VDADAHLLSARQTRRLLVSAGITIRERQFFLVFPERLYKHCSIVENALGVAPLSGQYVVFGLK